MRTTNARPLEERFWEKVDRKGPDDCWQWLGSTSHSGSGYGLILAGSKLVGAHRVSFELHHGVSLTSKEHILHACDNKRCVNPKHLRTGTQADNCSDYQETRARKAQQLNRAGGKYRPVLPCTGRLSDTPQMYDDVVHTQYGLRGSFVCSKCGSKHKSIIFEVPGA